MENSIRNIFIFLFPYEFKLQSLWPFAFFKIFYFS